MTEKQKMLAGEPYRSRDPELLAQYHRAKFLLKEFSALASTDAAEKSRVLKQLFGFDGAGVWIEAPFFCDYGENIEIGEGCFINYNCVLADNNRISVGNNVLIGPAVQIYTAFHPADPDKRIVEETGETHYLTQSRPVHIGDRAWIGGGAVLMPGVTVGRGSTIGAGSVVTRDIPDRCVAFGNPCRIVREL